MFIYDILMLLTRTLMYYIGMRATLDRGEQRHVLVPAQAHFSRCPALWCRHPRLTAAVL